mgnify:CR=1 FL=1
MNRKLCFCYPRGVVSASLVESILCGFVFAVMLINLRNLICTSTVYIFQSCKYISTLALIWASFNSILGVDLAILKSLNEYRAKFAHSFTIVSLINITLIAHKLSNLLKNPTQLAFIISERDTNWN